MRLAPVRLCLSYLIVQRIFLSWYMLYYCTLSVIARRTCNLGCTKWQLKRSEVSWYKWCEAVSIVTSIYFIETSSVDLVDIVEPNQKKMADSLRGSDASWFRLTQRVSRWGQCNRGGGQMAAELYAISNCQLRIAFKFALLKTSSSVESSRSKSSQSFEVVLGVCSDRRLTTIATAYISSLSASAVSSTLAPCHSAPYSPSQILPDLCRHRQIVSLSLCVVCLP